MKKRILPHNDIEGQILSYVTEKNEFAKKRAKICATCNKLCRIDLNCISCDCSFKKKLSEKDFVCPESKF